jgi:ABC-2 type transport system ATP-binding protein
MCDAWRIRTRTLSMDQNVSSFALEIGGLTKSFGKPAVDGLDLSVRAGEFYTLLA